MEYQRIGENDSELWFCADCLRRALPFIEASFNSSYNNGLDPDDRCALIGPDHTKSNTVVFLSPECYESPTKNGRNQELCTGEVTTELGHRNCGNMVEQHCG